MSVTFECWLDCLALNNLEKLFQHISLAVLGRKRLWIRRWECLYNWRERSVILPALHQSLALRTGLLGQAVWASPGACQKCRTPDLLNWSLHVTGRPAGWHMPTEVWAAFRERAQGSSGEAVPKDRQSCSACLQWRRRGWLFLREVCRPRSFPSRTLAPWRAKLPRQPLLYTRQIFTKLTDLHPLNSSQVHITHTRIYNIWWLCFQWLHWLRFD